MMTIPLTDELIAAEIQRALALDPDVNADEVRIDVQEGRVTLSGVCAIAAPPHAAAPLALVARPMRRGRGILLTVK
jgi:hypothetical protein